MSESDLLAALGGAAVPFEARGVKFLARPLTLAGAAKYDELRKAGADDYPARAALLISLCVTREDGSPLSAEFAAALPAPVADALAGRLAELNGWGDHAGN
jgi:hypothetical protein